MMRLAILSLTVLFGGFLSACMPEGADGSVEIDDAYALVTMPAQKNGAVFLIIENDGEADKVIAANSNVAERVELHTHLMDGGIMMMREVEHYDVAADSDTVLEPAGHHIMLMGLRAPLQAGDQFPLTLTFEKAGDKVIDVEIVKSKDELDD